jgi:hypothetical protein
MTNDELSEWVQLVKARGLAGVLAAALDALEPLGPLAAQMIWVAQPVAGLLLPRAALDAVARALEEPGGVERLRRQLDE